jgi:hypothetical protein
VRFGVGPLALRATKSAKAIPVRTEALTPDVAGPADHCFFGFFCAHHGLIIQLALAVSQEKNAGKEQEKRPFSGAFFVVVLDF